MYKQHAPHIMVQENKNTYKLEMEVFGSSSILHISRARKVSQASRN